jgi:hypothetical protein
MIVNSSETVPLISHLYFMIPGVATVICFVGATALLPQLKLLALPQGVELWVAPPRDTQTLLFET